MLLENAEQPSNEYSAKVADVAFAGYTRAGGASAVKSPKMLENSLALSCRHPVSVSVVVEEDLFPFTNMSRGGDEAFTSLWSESPESVGRAGVIDQADLWEDADLVTIFIGQGICVPDPKDLAMLVLWSLSAVTQRHEQLLLL